MMKFIFKIASSKSIFMFLFTVTLHDIVHTEKSLTLVFEYLERDLKQYMDDCGGILAMNNVKVIINIQHDQIRNRYHLK